MRLVSPSDIAELLYKPATPAKRLTARAVAAMNRLKVLTAVSRYGHLTAADLAAAVWPRAKYGRQMSQRTVRSLLHTGELAVRTNSLGLRSYVLTRPGAAFLEVRGFAARHGLDISSVSGATYRHSALCSRYCIEKENEGFSAWHEYAIAQGAAPVNQRQLIEGYGKLPDAVLTQGDLMWMVEVESAPKATEEIAKACAVVARVGRRLHPDCPFSLAGLVFVFDAEQNHAGRIARAASSRWAQYPVAERTALALRITLCRVTLGLPLVWRGHDSAPLRL